jgi:hypothetical protein
MAPGTFPLICTTRRRALSGAVSAFAALYCGTASGEEPTPLLFDRLYKSFGVRGYQFSDLVLQLSGKPVSIRGYMAPPLKPESAFFVLTREPLALCPFCQSDADWPVDIIVIYLKSASPLVSAGEVVVVRGKLEVGSWTDPETGFVSQLRVVEATYRRA